MRNYFYFQYHIYIFNIVHIDGCCFSTRASAATVIITQLPTECVSKYLWVIMTSSNGNIFRVIGLLCGEFTGDRWNPLTKASDA